MATRNATQAAKKEIKAVKSTPKQAAQAKIYRSRGGGSKCRRITIFLEEGTYGFNGDSFANYLDDMGYDDAVRDYVISDVEISKEDFQLAFEG